MCLVFQQVYQVNSVYTKIACLLLFLSEDQMHWLALLWKDNWSKIKHFCRNAKENLDYIIIHWMILDVSKTIVSSSHTLSANILIERKQEARQPFLHGILKQLLAKTRESLPGGGVTLPKPCLQPQANITVLDERREKRKRWVSKNIKKQTSFTECHYVFLIRDRTWRLIVASYQCT